MYIILCFVTLPIWLIASYGIIPKESPLPSFFNRLYLLIPQQDVGVHGQNAKTKKALPDEKTPLAHKLEVPCILNSVKWRFLTCMVFVNRQFENFEEYFGE